MSRGQDVEFDAAGVTLRGLFFPAAKTNDPAPGVVLAHGLGGEVSHFLTDFAEVFAEAGLATLAYDHRGWGRSDAAAGMPRQESEPFQQIRDYQHAITYIQHRPDVDAARIGAWGSSLSAGHVFVLGAIDRRLKAVVGQVPFISGSRTFSDLSRVDMADASAERFADDRLARGRGEAAAYMPVTDKDPMAVSALPSADAYEYFYGIDGVSERDPSFPNRITVRSMENCFGYEPGWYLSRITPTPFLMIVALGDRLTASHLALSALETAAHPKKLVTLACGHFGAYRGPTSDEAKTAARDFFLEHLRV